MCLFKIINSFMRIDEYKIIDCNCIISEVRVVLLLRRVINFDIGIFKI